MNGDVVGALVIIGVGFLISMALIIGSLVFSVWRAGK